MTDKKTAERNDHPESFESLMNVLEHTAKKLESDAIPLEESLKIFETGIIAGRKCENILNRTEKKIEFLLNDRNKDSGDA